MDYEEEERMDVVQEMDFSTASTTIDPSVIQSRIRQSASLQKEQAAASSMDEDDVVGGAIQQPVFPKLSAAQASGNKIEYRRVRCPPHRYTPLREHWEQILTPLVEYLKLQVRRTSSLLSSFYFSYAKEESTCTSECTFCCSMECTNPPGSQNGIKNELGRFYCRSLMQL
jgi:hypothetical protein